MRPSKPAMSVWLKRWVWLVWMRSGVRIQTFAAAEMSRTSISRSPLASPCRIAAIGISGARLSWTAAGEMPTAVAA